MRGRSTEARESGSRSTSIPQSGMSVRERLASRATSGTGLNRPTDVDNQPRRGGIVMDIDVRTPNSSAPPPTNTHTSQSSSSSSSSLSSHTQIPRPRPGLSGSTAVAPRGTFNAGVSESGIGGRGGRMTVVASNEPTSQRVLEQRLEAARRNGTLNLRGSGLTEIPESVLLLLGGGEEEDDVGKASRKKGGLGGFDLSFDRGGKSWWEQVDVTVVDLSMNKLTSLPTSLTSLCGGLVTLSLDENLLGSGDVILNASNNTGTRQPYSGSTRYGATNKNTLGGDSLGSANTIAIPDDFFSLMKNLKTLTMRKNHLQSLPSSVGTLTNLVEIHLDGNDITTLPLGLANLQHLQVISVRDNKLTSLFDQNSSSSQSMSRFPDPYSTTSPSSLSSITQGMNRLSLSRSTEGKTDDHPDTFNYSTSSSLLRLDLSGNRLTSQGLLPFSRFFQGMKNIRDIDLSRNQLDMAPSFAGCLSLLTLDLSYNQLSQLPSLPSATNPSTPTSQLQMLTCTHNRLVSIDTVLTCHLLSTLNISNNKIIELPGELSALKNLKVIDASSNDLADIPSSLGTLPSLNKLSLDGNPLRRIPIHKRSSGVLMLKKYLLSRMDEEDVARAEEQDEARVRGVHSLGRRGGPSENIENTRVGGGTGMYSEHKQQQQQQQQQHHQVPDRDNSYSSQHSQVFGRSTEALPPVDLRVLQAYRDASSSKKVTGLAGLDLGTLPVHLGDLAFLSQTGHDTSVIHLDLSRNRLGSSPPLVTQGIGGGHRLSSLGANRFGGGGVGGSRGNDAQRGKSLEEEQQSLDVLITEPYISTLTSLILDGNGFVMLPRAICSLAALQSLSLQKNKLASQALVSVSSPSTSSPSNFSPLLGRPLFKVLLSYLPNLIELDLRNNALEEFPLLLLINDETNQTSSSSSSPPPVHHLQVLRLGYNKLTSLSSSLLLHLPSLRELDISNNQLTSLPLPVLPQSSPSSSSSLPNSSSLPKPIHRHLQSLDASNNNITSIPLELGSIDDFPALATLQLVGNPQRTIRPATVNAGPLAVLKYLRDRQPIS